MPFTYAPVTPNPYTQSIAQLLEQSGAHQAQGLEQAAQARARGMELAGQATAQGIQGATQALGAIPQQVQQARMQQLEQQRLTGQIKLQGTQQAGADLSLDEARRAKQYHDDLAEILKTTPQQTEGGTSVYNLPAIEQQLAQRGHGQFAADTVKSLGGLNDAFRQEAAAKTALIQRGAQEVQRAGNSPVLASIFLDQLEKNQSYPKEQIDQFRKLIDADPANVAKITAALAGSVKLESVAPGGSLVNPNTAQPAFTAPDKPVTVPAGSSLVQPPSQPGGTVTPLYTAPEKTPNTQHVEFELPGKGRVMGEYAPGQDGQPGRYTYAGQDVTNVVKGPTPASITVNQQRDAVMAKGLPEWALDAMRPVGPDANVPDKTIGYTPNGLYQATLTYLDTGQFPQTGRAGDPTTQLKRDAVMNKAGAIAAAAGMDVPTLRAFYKSNAGSLAAVQKMADAVQSFMATADKNVASLKPLLAKLPDTGSPLFNRPLRAFTQDVAGNKDMAPIAVYLQSIRNEYGRIVSQPNLAGQLTDSARHEATQLVDDKATVAQMLASVEALNTEGNNRMVSLGDQIGRIAGRMNGPDNGNAPPPASTGPAIGTQGTVGGKPAEWRNGSQGLGWYAK